MAELVIFFGTSHSYDPEIAFDTPLRWIFPNEHDFLRRRHEILRITAPCAGEGCSIIRYPEPTHIRRQHCYLIKALDFSCIFSTNRRGLFILFFTSEQTTIWATDKMEDLPSAQLSRYHEHSRYPAYKPVSFATYIKHILSMG